MNKLDKQYQDLLQDILDNGVTKQDRTQTGTISVFGRQIRHKMSEGFPLLTTKKMPFKTIVTELLWFLRGDTNIKFLVDNNCHIWDGDAYKNFEKQCVPGTGKKMSQEEFINFIKTDDKFAEKWGNLGKIYGAQWRQWDSYIVKPGLVSRPDGSYNENYWDYDQSIDQIQNLINDLKTNPDSRRLMVNAWNVGELDQMVLPPCHYGFQVYTRELSYSERRKYRANTIGTNYNQTENDFYDLDKYNIPTRAISLMWNQRSCDFPLGIPTNIQSYALLLVMISKQVNMVPDELIGNLGDCHIYLNQIEGCKEQIGRELTLDERFELWANKENEYAVEEYNKLKSVSSKHDFLSDRHQGPVPFRTREPFKLPTIVLSDRIVSDISEYTINDLELVNYMCHPKIYFPLSN
jgi:thymidylate synthase